MNPSHVNATYSIASCQTKIGNLDEAINTYNQAFAMECDTLTGPGPIASTSSSHFRQYNSNLNSFPNKANMDQSS